jgi:hypothetical protein
VVPGSDPFVCPRCGTPAALDSRFCSGCGANLARKRRLRRKSDFDERQERIDERQAVSELSGRHFAELGFLSGEFAWRDVRRLKPLLRSGEEVPVAVQCDIVGSGWVAQGVVAATESRILFVSKDTLDPQVVHLKARDVTLICSSRAPLEKLLADRDRMGWSFNWVSTAGSDFHRDLGFAHTEEELKPFLEGEIPLPSSRWPSSPVPTSPALFRRAPA